jgi:hypothetical protein
MKNLLDKTPRYVYQEIRYGNDLQILNFACKWPVIYCVEYMFMEMVRLLECSMTLC